MKLSCLGARRPAFATLALLLVMVFSTGVAVRAQVLINEIVADNRSLLKDIGDGAPDMIELYNGSASDVALDDYASPIGDVDLLAVGPRSLGRKCGAEGERERKAR